MGINRRTIADTYVLSLIYDKVDGEAKWFSKFLLLEIRDTYVRVFRELMEKQLEKYKSEGRTTIGLGNFYNAELYEFPKFFSCTLRTNLQQYNDLWVKLAQLIVELSELKDEKAIIKKIDTINYSLHNGKSFVLGKFPNGRSLIEMLNLKFTSAAQLLPYASAEVKYLNNLCE
jgi:hypothetical protein